MSRLSAIFLLLLPFATVACVDDWAQMAREDTEPPTSQNAEISPLDAAFFAGYEAELEDAMKRFDVPGAAVAVVAGDHVVYSRGFGFRNTRRRQPVTEDTLFRLGSASRALTLTMLGTLVDEDRLEWNRLVAGLDLLHLLDCGSGSVETAGFLEPDISIEELLARYSEVDLQPSPGDGEGRDAFVAATYAAISGAGDRRSPEVAFRRLMHAKLLGPAGMTRTVVGGTLSAMGQDYASPYGMDLEGRLAEMDADGVRVYDPYEGVASTVSDMARFMILQVQDGIAHSRKRVISPANLEPARGGEGTVGDCLDWQRTEPCRRGMGWIAVDVGGGEVVRAYRGGIAGFSVAMGYLQRQGVGWVVLNNKDPELGGRDFNGQAMDAFLSRAVELPWDRHKRLEEYERRLASLEGLAKGVKPLRPAAVRPYLGTYAGGWQLSLEDQDLRLLRRMQRFPITGHDDGFLIPQGLGMGTRIRFREHGDGSVTMAFTALDGAELAAFGKLN